MALVRNFFALIGFLVVLVVLAGAGWFFREDIQAWMNSRNEIVMTEPSPELAEVARDKLQAILDGEVGGESRLTEAELQSYVRYIAAERLPPGVNNPALEIRDSTLAISAGLDLRVLQVPGADDAIQNLRRALGDSALVTTELLPAVTRPGQGRVQVMSLQAGMIPVPPMLIGMAIGQLGLPTEGSSVLFAIPADVTELRVENDEVVLVRGG